MTSASKRIILILIVALATLGQSCSISFGNTQPKDGGIYRTDDQAKTWRQKTYIRTEKKRRIGLDDATIVFLRFDPTNSNRLYAGVRGLGVWSSADRGEKWVASGLKTGSYHCLTFDPATPAIMYVASGNQIRKTTDQGKTWAVVYTEPQSAQTIECLAVDPARGSIIWTVTSGGKVVRSADYGANWTLVNTAKTLAGVRYMEVDPITNGLVVFTARNGIHRLDASGTEATDISAPLDVYKKARSIADVEWVTTPTGTQWYLATSYGILVSADGGGTWQEISTLLNPNSTPVANIAVNPIDPREIYLTTGRRLHRTTDGGGSWAVTTLPSTRTPVWLSIDPANPDRLYVGTFVPIKK